MGCGFSFPFFDHLDEEQTQHWIERINEIVDNADKITDMTEDEIAATSEYLLIQVLKKNDLDFPKKLLASSIVKFISPRDRNDPIVEAFGFAIAYGNVEAVKLMKLCNFDPSINDNVFLAMSVGAMQIPGFSFNSEIVEFLLDDPRVGAFNAEHGDIVNLARVNPGCEKLVARLLSDKRFYQ